MRKPDDPEYERYLWMEDMLWIDMVLAHQKWCGKPNWRGYLEGLL